MRIRRALMESDCAPYMSLSSRIWMRQRLKDFWCFVNQISFTYGSANFLCDSVSLIRFDDYYRQSSQDWEAFPVICQGCYGSLSQNSTEGNHYRGDNVSSTIRWCWITFHCNNMWFKTVFRNFRTTPTCFNPGDEPIVETKKNNSMPERFISNINFWAKVLVSKSRDGTVEL